MRLTVAQMPDIDRRLLECTGEPEATENFNRVLALLDALTARVTALEPPAAG